jgi:hypothetical protein
MNERAPLLEEERNLKTGYKVLVRIPKLKYIFQSPFNSFIYTEEWKKADHSSSNPNDKQDYGFHVFIKKSDADHYLRILKTDSSLFRKDWLTVKKVDIKGIIAIGEISYFSYGGRNYGPDSVLRCEYVRLSKDQ